MEARRQLRITQAERSSDTWLVRHSWFFHAINFLYLRHIIRIVTGIFLGGVSLKKVVPHMAPMYGYA
jgi:hypothetical protein